MNQSYLDLIDHLKNDPIIDENLGENLFLLYELIFSYKKIKKPKALDLGTGRGGSLIPLALGCRDTQGKVVTVSLHDQETAKQKVEKYKLSNYVEFIFGDDRDPEIIKKIESFSPFDVIFMDTSKEEEHSIFEIRTYSKFLSVGGFFAFHDTEPSNVTRFNYGIRRAIDRFLRENKNFIIIFDRYTSYGLLILKRMR